MGISKPLDHGPLRRGRLPNGEFSLPLLLPSPLTRSLHTRLRKPNSLATAPHMPLVTLLRPHPSDLAHPRLPLIHIRIPLRTPHLRRPSRLPPFDLLMRLSEVVSSFLKLSRRYLRKNFMRIRRNLIRSPSRTTNMVQVLLRCIFQEQGPLTLRIRRMHLLHRLRHRLNMVRLSPLSFLMVYNLTHVADDLGGYPSGPSPYPQPSNTGGQQPYLGNSNQYSGYPGSSYNSRPSGSSGLLGSAMHTLGSVTGQSGRIQNLAQSKPALIDTGRVTHVLC